MNFLEAFKRWLKAMAIFWAGFAASCAFAIALFSLVAIMQGMQVSAPSLIEAVELLFRMTAIAVFCFLVFWGWFSFRARRQLDSLRWFELLIASVLIVPLMLVLSLPFLFAGIALNVWLAQAGIPLFCILLLSEAASWIPKIRARAEGKSLAAAVAPPADCSAKA